YYNAELAAGMKRPEGGSALISVRDRDKPKVLKVAEDLARLGFKILATKGTAEYLERHGVMVEKVLKLGEGRPHVVDKIINGEVNLIINTPSGRGARSDGYHIRRTAVDLGIPYITTVPGALAAVKGIEAVKNRGISVKAIQEYHGELEEVTV
ncbi:MAG: carbamoyl phosphate synthase large subunit, partial [Candidatus Bathyarchaeia archaeon]